MSTSTSPTLRDAIQSARQQHRAGAGAVLDILLRMPGVRAEDLGAQLEIDAGVAVLADASDAAADFGGLDLPSSTPNGHFGRFLCGGSL